LQANIVTTKNWRQDDFALKIYEIFVLYNFSNSRKKVLYLTLVKLGKQAGKLGVKTGGLNFGYLVSFFVEVIFFLKLFAVHKFNMGVVKVGEVVMWRCREMLW
jgi:hypothetical protein